jgi:DNA-binding GntR family transcriptional regulator
VTETSPASLRRISRPTTLAAMVLDQIRDLIITGALGLGEQLSENALAAQLDVSRTPVRDALLRLQEERLVDVRPQRGTFVFRYDATELREISELREVLETGALRVAVARDRGALIESLRARVGAATAAVLDAQSYQAHDTLFHETLVQASGNRELSDAYERISGRVRAIRYRLTRSAAQVALSQRDHGDIVAALAAGEPAEAEARLRRHVYNSYRFFMEMSERTGTPQEATQGDD